MKRLLALLLAMALTLCACGQAAPVSTPEPEAAAAEPEKKTNALQPENCLIGIAMPSGSNSQLNRSVNHLIERLEAAGYGIELEYAYDDAETQIDQIKTMLADGAKILIVTACDAASLETVLKQASEVGTTVITYQNVLLSATTVPYYVNYDFYQAGILQGQYLVEQLGLADAGGKTFTIELTGGGQGDMEVDQVFYQAAMSVLQPYFDSGVLVCPSGQTKLEEIVSEAEDPSEVMNRFVELCQTYYTEQPLDAVLALSDFSALGVAAALDAVYENETYPVMTGMGCEPGALKNILEDKQAMSVFMDPAAPAEQAFAMCNAIIRGEAVEVNDTTTYDFGAGAVPAYLCAPVVCTRDNYQALLIDSGYITEAQLGR